MKVFNWRSALSSYFTQLNGVVLFVYYCISPPHQQNRQLAVRGRNEFIYFALYWTGKSTLDPVKRSWSTNVIFGSLQHGGSLCTTFVLYWDSTHTYARPTKGLLFLSLCLGMATGSVETFLFRERRERDWMECSLQVDSDQHGMHGCRCWLCVRVGYIINQLLLLQDGE
jgi:hypothetical protein